jgi:signal transduction histidine kinase
MYSTGWSAAVREMIGVRDQLLLDVSHELRSPLTRLKGALELIADPEMKTRMAADLAEMEIMFWRAPRPRSIRAVPLEQRTRSKTTHRNSPTCTTGI